MGNINKYGDISPSVAGHAARKLLERGQYDMVIERFMQARPLPKHKTKTMKFRRYEALPRADAPLAEGIPPAGRKMTKTDVEATLEQYGDLVELTDVIVDTHTDAVLSEYMDICGEQAAETIEVIRIAVGKAGTNVFYANSAASRAAVNSPATRGDLRLIYRAFRKQKAKMIAKIVKASSKISTEPVAPAFFALGSTDLDSDIRNLEGFVPYEQYSSSDRALPNEIGKCENIRFVLTQLFEPWLTSGLTGTTYLSGGAAVSSTAQCDVYPILIFAQDCFAGIPLQGEGAVTPYVINPTTVSHSNPLGQSGFVSWKTYQTACILNQNWLARLEVSATATPS